MTVEILNIASQESENKALAHLRAGTVAQLQAWEGRNPPFKSYLLGQTLFLSQLQCLDNERDIFNNFNDKDY